MQVIFFKAHLTLTITPPFDNTPQGEFSGLSSSSSVKDQYDSIQIRRKGSKNGNNNININAPIGLKKGR